MKFLLPTLVLLIEAFSTQALARSMSDLDIMTREEIIKNLEPTDPTLDMSSIVLHGFSENPATNCHFSIEATALTETNNFFCTVCFTLKKQEGSKQLPSPQTTICLKD